MSRRDRMRDLTIAEIKATARQQMAESGTAGVSLSAIARAMEMSAPALYRYFASRDDLVTALIADAYNDLAATLEAADASRPGTAYADRLLAVLLAYRDWAMAHPVDFSLIYGTPIPGYHAPVEVTMPPARRGFAVILGILAEAMAAGVLKPQPEQLALPPGLEVRLPVIGDAATESVPPVVVYIGVMGWARIHGMLMLGLFGHADSLVSNQAAFYRHEVESLLRSIGLHPTTPEENRKGDDDHDG